ncbi:acyl-CoA dehydrogenase family protein [Streptomyces lydicus]|uniref:acyl-CoA dehydrogenase family protein n=1 Tax=Streptomyces lydicus TaxID=47763 RepID=UPI000527115A|nr:acyl-CoA dehydrogenase family protein [Streptomyces lydicus]MDC7338023.1 acyl-CoA/acyl-ACP dehydrogenase [Streptomyces lydicus]UEG92564.1 acyl-CoA/acyl-ACP dehydrogenase [Streptomyces lydicus]
MDFTFTEEQQAAVEAARAVFSGVVPDSVPSPALTPGAVAEDFDRALWHKLADTDLLSLLIAPEHGGAGLDPIALCLVLRESAKVLARVPLLESGAAALTIQQYATEALRAEVLPGIAGGELVVTVAATGRTGHEPAERAVAAHRDGSDWLLTGTQTAVPWAATADRILLPAHATDGHAVVALVPRTHPGVTLDDQVSTSGERLAEVRLDGVRLSSREVIADPAAWESLRNVLTTGTCALALGLGERVLALTSDYTSKREQFGFPVATFQAVAVQAADRFIDLRAMEATLWQAAWRITTDTPGPLPPAGDIAVAKIWASEGVRRVVQTAQHLHGGFGADTDYVLHRYHAWAKQLELSLGPAAAHEEALGDLLAAHPLG